MHFLFKPKGVCCSKIEFVLTPVLDATREAVDPHNYMVTHIKFTGGCQGNLSFIAKSLTGYTVDYLIRITKGHKCGTRPTSCMDQFGKFLEQAKEIMDEKEWTVDDCL